MDTEQGGGLKDLSIGQMNALREKLGLKPLKTSGKEEENEQHDKRIAEEEEAAKRKQAQELEEKLERLKELRAERERKRKLKQIGTLGDSDDEDDGSLTSWISKSRQIQAEKALAKKREQLLAELDENDEDEPRKPSTRPVADGAIISGVKVAHGIDQFSVGESHILTLADRPILSKGVIDDEADELESAALVEKSTLEQIKQMRSGKKKYDPYSSDPMQIVDEQGQSNILPHYDEIDNLKERERAARRKEAFVLEGDTEIAPEKVQPVSVRAKLAQVAQNATKIDGSYQVKFASDFLTKDEMTVFKKKSKPKSESSEPKKKLRKKKKNLADELLGINAEDQESHLGSRQDRANREREQKIMEVTSALEKREKYKKAVNKAERDSALLLEQYDEDDELYNSLARARELSQHEKVKHDQEVAETLYQRQQEQQMTTASEEISGPAPMDISSRKITPKKELRLVFDSTSEFIKTIPTIEQQQYEEEDDLEKMRQKAREKSAEETVTIKQEPVPYMDIEPEIEPEEGLMLAPSKSSLSEEKNAPDSDNEDASISQLKQAQKFREKKRKRGLQSGEDSPDSLMDDVEDDKETTDKKRRKIKSETASEITDEPVEALLGSEPLVSKGILSTLELLKSRGELEEEALVGRASDERLDPVNQHGDVCVVEYLDEHGRRMTTKEAYRRLSYKFHGKAPSKNKVEKRQEKELKEIRRNRVTTTEVPLSTHAAIQKTTAATSTPFVVVGATIKPDLSAPPPARLSKNKKKSKNKDRKNSASVTPIKVKTNGDDTPATTRSEPRASTSTSSGLDSGVTTPSRHTKGTTTFTTASATNSHTPISESGKKVSFGFK